MQSYHVIILELITITVPNNYLVFTQVHSGENNKEVKRTDIRMMSLDISGQYIDVLMPIELNRTESVFIAYDQVDHRVCFTKCTCTYNFTLTTST